jgi:hypothetical protein
MSELTKQALRVENNQSFPNNNAGLITPTALRGFNEDMIDSTVNQAVYTADSASFNSRINAITGSGGSVNTGSLLTTASAVGNVMTFTKGDASTFNVTVGSVIPSGTISGSQQITALGFVSSSVTGSSLVTASFSGNTLTFTKGDSSTFGIVIPDNSGSVLPSGVVSGSSQINYPQISNIPAGIVSGSSQITPLLPTGVVSGSSQISQLGFQTTASFNAYTSSNDSKVNSLINATSSYAISSSVAAVDAGQQLQINSLIAATSSYVTSAITASSLITASFDNGTRNLTFTKGNNTQFSVNIPDVSGSTGNFVTTASFNAFTESQETKDTTLQSVTASLNSATASLFTSTSLSLYNASISGQLLTFTKGNNTQFTLTVPTGSGIYVTGSYGAFQDNTTQSGSANTAYRFKFNTTDISDGVILSGSTGLQVGAYGVYNLQWSGQAAQGSGAAIVSIWVNVNGIEVPGTRGDVTLASNTKLLPAWTYLLTLNQNDVVELEWASNSNNTTWQYLPEGTTPTTPSAASIIASLNRVDVGGGSNSVSNTIFNAYTASNNTKWNTLGGLTGSYATTGSNNFIGNQTITGSLTLSSSAAVDLRVIGGTTMTGSLLISSSVGLPFANTNGILTQYFGNTFGGNIGINDNSTLDEIGFALDGADWTINWGNGPIIYVNNTPGDTYEGVFGFQNKANYTDGRITALKRLDVSGSVNIQNTLTASLQQGYVWVGAANGRTTTVSTGSFGGGGGSAFPFTGSAQITGSLGLTGSISEFVNTLTIASSTASVNFNDGNMFTLTLVTGSVTHITPTNIRRGQTINIQINQPAGVSSGSVSFSPNVLFAGGNDYQATATGSAIDLLTFVSLDGTNVLGTSIKNFL